MMLCTTLGSWCEQRMAFNQRMPFRYTILIHLFHNQRIELWHVAHSTLKKRLTFARNDFFLNNGLFFTVPEQIDEISTYMYGICFPFVCLHTLANIYPSHHMSAHASLAANQAERMGADLRNI